MNQCIFLGKFVYDPELKEVPRGDNAKTYVSNFKLAVTRKFKKGSGGVGKQISYLNFEIWDTACQLLCEQFRKGDFIIVNCSARSEVCETNDGKKFDRVKFRVENFEFLPVMYKDEEINEET